MKPEVLTTDGALSTVPSVSSWKRRTLAGRRFSSGFYPTTTCRKNRKVEAPKGPIDGPAMMFQVAIVVKTVDVAPSKRQRVSPS